MTLHIIIPVCSILFKKQQQVNLVCKLHKFFINQVFNENQVIVM